jgi:hypothetical protein
VPELTLPSNATVTYRDALTAKDKFRVQAAIRLSLDTATGLQESSGSIVNDMRNALLCGIITAWSFDNLPLPSIQASVLDDLDLDDYNALADAVEPLLDKVVNAGPNRRERSGS